MVAVTHIKSCYVHAGLEHSGEGLFVFTRGAKGGDNLGTFATAFGAGVLSSLVKESKKDLNVCAFPMGGMVGTIFSCASKDFWRVWACCGPSKKTFFPRVYKLITCKFAVFSFESVL